MTKSMLIPVTMDMPKEIGTAVQVLNVFETWMMTDNSAAQQWITDRPEDWAVVDGMVSGFDVWMLANHMLYAIMPAEDALKNVWYEFHTRLMNRDLGVPEAVFTALGSANDVVTGSFEENMVKIREAAEAQSQG